MTAAAKRSMSASLTARADDWRMYWVSGARISAARSAALNCLESRRQPPLDAAAGQEFAVPLHESARVGAHAARGGSRRERPVVGFHLPAEDDFEGKRRGETVVHRCERREGMGDVVRHRGRAVVDRDAGIGGAQQHPAACVEISRITYRPLERARDQRERGMSIEVVPGVAADVRAGLQGVREGVEAGPRRERGRQGHGELRVEDDPVGLGLGAPDPDLPARAAGEDVGRGELRARARGRRDADLGNRSLRQRPAFHREVGRTAVRHRHRRGHLADVHGRSAAEADDQTRVCGPHERGRCFDLLLLGLAHYVREHHDLGARRLKRHNEIMGHAQLDERAVGHHDHRLVGIADGGRIRRDVARAAAAESGFRNPSYGERGGRSLGGKPGAHAQRWSAKLKLRAARWDACAAEQSQRSRPGAGARRRNA